MAQTADMYGYICSKCGWECFSQSSRIVSIVCGPCVKVAEQEEPVNVVANVALRVSDKHNSRMLEVAPLGSRCDWQPGEVVGTVNGEAGASYVSVLTKYGQAYADLGTVTLAK